MVLRSFELASGLKINFSKSNIMGIKIEEERLKATSIFFAGCIGKIPFKFLGIPVGASPRRFNTWEPVIKGMRQKSSSCKSKQLSIGIE